MKSRFFNKYTWSVDRIRQYRQHQMATVIHQHYAKQRGRKPTLYFIIDDSVIPKQGHHFSLLGRHYCTKLERVVWGHCLVFSYLVAGKIEGPWDWALYLNQRFCSTRRFQTKIEMAIAMIEAFEPPYPGKLLVYTWAAIKRQGIMRWDEAKGQALQSLVPVIEEIRQALVATVWVLLCYLLELVSISDPKGAQKGVVM